MSTSIEGKVAAIIDDTTLVLNVGSEQGVQEGMAFAIFALHGEIADPDSGQPLGRWEAVKARVVATHVQDAPVYGARTGRRRGAGGGRYPAVERDDGRALGGPRTRAKSSGSGWRCEGADVRGTAPEPAHCRGGRSAVAGGRRGRCEQANGCRRACQPKTMRASQRLKTMRVSHRRRCE